MESAIIIKNLEIASGIFVLEFKRNFNFEPGQVVKITTREDLAPRMYSIASGTQEEHFRIVYDVKPEGILTNELKERKAGQILFVSLPFGQFRCKEPDACCIANGTGIAPFYAILKSDPPEALQLIQGARYPERFLFLEELRGKLGDHYIPCCSGKKEEGFFHGRVTDYLKSLPSVDPSRKFYLCGSAEMVVEVRDLLIEKGASFGNIFSEIYF